MHRRLQNLRLLRYNIYIDKEDADLTLRDEIAAFRPYNEQEVADQQRMLSFLDHYPETLFSRDSSVHFTASAWIVNHSRTRVLMIFHNIYRSWSWTGGHATEPYDLIDLSVKKARTETGLSSIRPAYEDIYSLEIIATSGYYKEPNYIPSHLHLNLTYLLEADESEEIKTDESETCGAKWFDLRRAAMLSNGAWIRSIYEKLNAKLDIS